MLVLLTRRAVSVLHVDQNYNFSPSWALGVFRFRILYLRSILTLYARNSREVCGYSRLPLKPHCSAFPSSEYTCGMSTLDAIAAGRGNASRTTFY